jgi:malonyl-CoA/methylmalonyl-CoA synthetase
MRPEPGSIVWFTTGSWGEPRPMVFAPAHQARWWDAADRSAAGSVLLAHDAATSVGLRVVLGTLRAGGCVHLLERWQPGRVARRLRHGGFDRLAASGPQLNQLAAVPACSAQRERWAPLPRIDAAGGALHRAAALRLSRQCGAEVATAFTLTEAAGRATERQPGPARLHHPLDVGMARPGVVVSLRRRAGQGPGRGDGSRALPDDRGVTASEVSPGEVGEVHLAGDVLGRPVGPAGARVDPQATDAIATGDLGRLDTDGSLRLLGRHTDRFVCDGVEVAPALLELVLAGHPAVADVAIVPRPDGDLGSVPVAVIVPADPEAPPFLADLARRLGELPPAWRPRAEAVVDRLPLTASGQLHRRMLAYDEAAR